VLQPASGVREIIKGLCHLWSYQSVVLPKLFENLWNRHASNALGMAESQCTFRSQRCDRPYDRCSRELLCGLWADDSKSHGLTPLCLPREIQKSDSSVQRIRSMTPFPIACSYAYIKTFLTLKPTVLEYPTHLQLSPNDVLQHLPLPREQSQPLPRHSDSDPLATIYPLESQYHGR